MNACHTHGQRQAAGIDEEIKIEQTRGAKAKRNQRQVKIKGNLEAKTNQCTDKTYACKQCGFNSKTKEEQWVHAKGHIPNEKQLNCTKCQFVTEHKHHLVYHTRNHSSVKPFKCNQCKYTCVTSSMLSSHMK